MAPIISLAGPLGSGVAEGVRQAPTWAALQLDQERENRQKKLAEFAQEQGLEKMALRQETAQMQRTLFEQQQASEKAAQEAIPELALLRIQAGQEPDPETRLKLHDQGSERLLRQMQAGGASAAMMRMAAQDVVAARAELAKPVDALRSVNHWARRAAGGDEAAGMVAQELEALAGSGLSGEQLAQYGVTLYRDLRKEQVSSLVTAAENARAQERYSEVLDPNGPIMRLANDGLLDIGRLLEAIMEKDIESAGMPFLEATRHRQEARKLLERGGGGEVVTQPVPMPEPAPDMTAQLAQGGNRFAAAAKVAEQEAVTFEMGETIRKAKESFGPPKQVKDLSGSTSRRMMQGALRKIEAAQAAGTDPATAAKEIMQWMAETYKLGAVGPTGEVQPNQEVLDMFQFLASLSDDPAERKKAIEAVGASVGVDEEEIWKRVEEQMLGSTKTRVPGRAELMFNALEGFGGVPQGGSQSEAEAGTVAPSIGADEKKRKLAEEKRKQLRLLDYLKAAASVPIPRPEFL